MKKSNPEKKARLKQKASLAELKRTLRRQASKDKARHSELFFKSGPGEYAEGDQFLGLTVPAQRKLARQFQQLSLTDLAGLLSSPWHEERLTALFIMVLRFQGSQKLIQKTTGSVESQKAQEEMSAIYNLYFDRRNYVNNWDLVDSSAEHIMGPVLFEKNRNLLVKMVSSPNLWDRRIAILTTFYFIKRDDFSTTLELCRRVLRDSEDLIHKASGWMLREIGKRNLKAMTDFLDIHAPEMPRTMLRYAIEKLPERKRKYYMGLDRS